MLITEKKLRSFIREALSQDREADSPPESAPETKRKIFVLVGPPSSGKGWWIENVFTGSSPYIISRDNVVDEVAKSYGWTYDDMFEAPPKSAKLGDMHEKYGKVVESPAFMTWQPLSYSEVLNANNEVGAKHAANVAAAADSGLDIVVDMTNMSAWSRKNALAPIKGREDEFMKIAVVFPFEGAEEAIMTVSDMRAAALAAAGGSKTIPRDRMQKMMGSFEPPTAAEGFDKIVSYDNRAKIRDIAASGVLGVSGSGHRTNS